MNSDAWLTGVVGVSGVVLIALVLVVLRALSQARPVPPGSTRPAAPPPSSAAHAARSLGYMFGVLNTPRRRRSVEDNLQRAFARIDAVDPHGAQRRIGLALADVGLVSSDPEPDADRQPSGGPRPSWPYDQRSHQRAGERQRREDQE